MTRTQRLDEQILPVVPAFELADALAIFRHAIRPVRRLWAELTQWG